METVEEDLLARSLADIEKAHKAGKPFFLWHNSTRNHVWIHLVRQVEEQDRVWRVCRRDGGTGLRHRQAARQPRRTGHRRRHDRHVFHGQRRRDLQVAAGRQPCRSGARRALPAKAVSVCPCVVRWPGVIKPGTVINDIFSHEDWMPTLLAAVGDPDVKEKLLQGMQVGDKTFKAHIDGYNQMDLLSGKGPGQAQGDLLFRRRWQSERPAARRLEDHLHRNVGQSPHGLAQDAQLAVDRQPPPGSLRALHGPIAVLHEMVRGPDVHDGAGTDDHRNIPGEPEGIPSGHGFESEHQQSAGSVDATGLQGSLFAKDWWVYEFWRFVFVQQEVAKLAQTAIEFPPMQKGASFNLEAVKAQIEKAMQTPQGK